MSSNPNFPEQPNHLPTAGENPNAAGHLENIPYDKVSLEEARAKGELREDVDTGELVQIQTGEYWSPRQPAQELPTTPEKKSKSLKIALAAGGATVAAVLGAWGFSVGASSNGVIQNPNANNTLPPAPETVNTAPVTPGNSIPTPTFEAPEKPVVAGPESIANYDQLVKDAQLTKGEYKTEFGAIPGFAEQFTKLVNYQPTGDELNASKNLVSKTSSLVGPEAAAEIYRAAILDNIIRGDGPLRSQLEAIGKATFKKWYETRTEEKPYKLTFTYNRETRLFELTDNANYNSFPDDPIGTAYNLPADIKITNPTSAGQDSSEVYYQIPANTSFVKVGTIPNQ